MTGARRDTEGLAGGSGAASAVLRPAAVVAGCTACSRVLGFVREVLMAQVFGTTLAKSAFDVAFRVPNLFRRLFGEGALSAALVPVFTETLHREGGEAANRLAGRVLTLLSVALAMTVLGGLLLIALWLRWLSPGPKAAAVLPLLAVMLPYLLFICLVAVCMGLLNARHHFLAPAATPLLLNLVWIGAVLWVCPLFGARPEQRIRGVAWAVVAAGALQLLVQVPVLLKLGLRPPLLWSWRDRALRRVLTLMAPAAAGMGVHQVNVVVDGLLALWVGAWAPAALTYAERLIYLPLGVFATALGTVLLPTFSRQAACEDPRRLLRTLNTSLRGLMAIMVPAAAGLAVLAEPIVRLTFEWRGGLFDARSTLLTARAVRFYAPGLVVFSLYKMLVPAFYALKDTRTPLRVGLYAVALNLGLNLLFVLTWPREYAHGGLALATVIASLVNGTALAVLLHRRLGSPGWARVGTTLLRVAAATLVMALAAGGCHALLASSPALAGWWPKGRQAAAVAGGMAAGALVYGPLIALLCPGEAARLAGRFRMRLRGRN